VLGGVNVKNIVAVDLGASSGRVVKGLYDGEEIKTKVVYRFSNEGIKVNKSIYWNILGIYNQIKNGITKASSYEESITSLGVDSWGVDYAYLSSDGNLISSPYHYRDSRTNKLYEEIFSQLNKSEIYKETGIQFIPINTLVQLWADKKYRPWVFDLAEDFLMIPDLINFFLTGEKFNEYTNASTTQLFNVKKGVWSKKIFRALDYPKNMIKEIIYPGTLIGEINENISTDLNLFNKNIPVFSVGSHDTASAVAAIPFKNNQNSAFISNGTWSLLGAELDEPIINQEAFEENFTNECGVNNRIRFLKNITGLWLIEQCKQTWEEKEGEISYEEITNKAYEAKGNLFRINPNNPRFINPDNMIEEIINYCKETKQCIPRNFGEIVRGIYESLAADYCNNINKLEKITGKDIETIHMVGGGARSDILCELTAKHSGRRVIAGPFEATALGNIIVQLIAQNEVSNLEEGRELIRKTIKLKYYE